MTSPLTPDYRQIVSVETPEQVVLEQEVAGVGSRMLAAMIDALVVTLLAIAGLIAMAFLRRGSEWAAAVSLLVIVASMEAYFVLFEGLSRGQTPGKRALQIRVIRDDGHGVTISDALLRNLLRPVDMIGLVGALFIAIDRKGRRLGDFVAGTVVVRDQPALGESQLPIPDAAADVAVGAPVLSDHEFHLLSEYLGRAPSLPEDVRLRLANRLSAQFGAHIPANAGTPHAALTSLHAAERGRRAGRFAGARSNSRSWGARLVAVKRTRWSEFDALAQRVSRRGLDALSARELPDFAGRYREVAADLARARTYQADDAVVQRLERLVSAGHNALYRNRVGSWRRLLRWITLDCPAAVVASWRYVAMAALVFVVPGIAGYALLHARPSLAPELLPDTFIERADAAATRIQHGQGFVQVMNGEAPFMSAMIISNNVRVAFRCFASGIFVGVGSLLSLAFNGLMLGSTSGYYAARGLLGYLWTFVLGHGALEIFAIWISGAAGFMLGVALIAPGEFSRRDALALAGRNAVRMIGTAVILLLIAGSIEGLISASAASLGARALASAGSVLVLIVYLTAGARHLAREQAALPTTLPSD